MSGDIDSVGMRPAIERQGLALGGASAGICRGRRGQIDRRGKIIDGENKSGRRWRDVCLVAVSVAGGTCMGAAAIVVIGSTGNHGGSSASRIEAVDARHRKYRLRAAHDVARGKFSQLTHDSSSPTPRSRPCLIVARYASLIIIGGRSSSRSYAVRWRICYRVAAAKSRIGVVASRNAIDISMPPIIGALAHAGRAETLLRLHPSWQTRGHHRQ